MLKNYFKIALRNILQHKATSFINIGGLAIGMACAILIFLWVQDELSYDRFHENANELHLVGMKLHYPSRILPVSKSPGPLGAALTEYFPEIIKFTRFFRQEKYMLEYSEIKFNETGGIYADPSIFEMFTFPLLTGDSETALDNPHSIVLTEQIAEKYFGNQDPLGKVVRLDNQHDLRVTGILKNIPHNSSLKFDFIIPIQFLKELGHDFNQWGQNRYRTYLLTQKNTSYQNVNKKFKQLYTDGEFHAELFLHPLSRMHLYSTMWDWDWAGFGDIQYVQFFTLVAFFVLLIACINYMNLATARSIKRSTEIGLRKVVGANRLQLIRQLLSESVLITLIAFLSAIALVELLLPVFRHLSGKPLELVFINNKIVLMLIATAVLTGVVSGSYPALFLSAFKPVKILKGRMDSAAGGSIFRKILVVFQFSLSIGLIVGALVVYNQLNYIQNKKLGLDKENIIYISLQGDLARKYEMVKSACLKNADILNITRASDIPTYLGGSSGGWDWEGKDTHDDVLMNHAAFGFDFLETFNMKMAEGRFYSKTYLSELSKVVVVNEEAVRFMGIMSPIGKRLSRGNQNYTIIGVMKDFHFFSLREKIAPIVIGYNFLSDMPYMFLKISHKNVGHTINFLENICRSFNPDYPFEYHFLDEDFDRLYHAEQRVGVLFRYFALLAVLIACLGLFGLASFSAEQRTKEIGIRKVFGASVAGIVALLSKDFIKWVIIANAVSWPIAYFFMNNWQQNFAYRTSIGLLTFLFAGALALVIALLTVSFLAIRAALANPIDALRYE